MMRAMKTAARMDSIGTETAFEVSRAGPRARGDRPLDRPPPDRRARLRHAGERARGGEGGLDAGLTHYPPYAGLPDLRAAIAADTTARRGFAVEPSNVFVTVGGKGVMVYAIMALVDPGDEVIVPDPGYPIYESITRFVGGTPVPIPIRMENDFRLDVDELASLDHAADEAPRHQLAGESRPAAS